MIKNILNKDAFRGRPELQIMQSALNENNLRLYNILDEIISQINSIQTGNAVYGNTVRTTRSDVVLPPVNPWADPADATHDGYLLSVDWVTFNNKYAGLPSQLGHNGHVLYSNGTSEYWGALDLSGNDHALLNNLDYASAGHTGFQQELGFIPLPASHITDYDHTTFITLADVHSIPAGGAANEVLMKVSATDYDAVWASAGSGGFGTVTNFSFVTNDGVSGTVTNPTTTPELTLTLGTITPANINVDSGGYIKINSLTAVNYVATDNWFLADAGTVTLSGSNNIGIGTNVLDAATSVSDTVGIGYYALSLLTSGVQNVAVGYQALKSITTSSFNTALGYNVMSNAVGAAGNTGIGCTALMNLTSGDYNTAVGMLALEYLTTAGESVAVGDSAGRYGTGGLNTFLGRRSGEGNSSSCAGAENVGVGHKSLWSYISGSGNCAVGTSALQALTTGFVNTAVGYYSLVNCTEGTNNVGVGNEALRALTTGDENTAVGVGAGSSITTVDSCVFIGAYAGKYETAGNAFYLDSISRGSSAAEKAGALLYGGFHATPSSQFLYVNAGDIRLGTNATNYTKFDSTGHQTMVGTAKPWNDIRVEPVARATGTNAPTFRQFFDDSGIGDTGTTRGVYLYEFDDAVVANEKEVHFTIQMPHDWDDGEVHLHLHWLAESTATSTAVRWGLEYTWAAVHGTFGATNTIYASTPASGDTGMTAGKHQITEFSVVNPPDGLSTIIIGRLFRNSSHADDTYTGDVGLLYIDGHYQISSIGSTDELTK